jgi:hypothetical protein
MFHAGHAMVPDASVVGDAAMTRAFVHDEIQNRTRMRAADVAHAMGHEPAGRLHAAELARCPAPRVGFAEARETVRAGGELDDVHPTWLASLMTLATPAHEVVPSFMHSPAWGDLRANTLAVGYRQLRHATVLYGTDE